MSEFLHIFIRLVLIGWAGVASAQTSLNTNALKLSDGETSSSTSWKSRNQIEIQQSQYVSYGLPEYRSGAANQNSSLILRLDEELRRGPLQASLKARDQWSATEKWNYADVFELYAGLGSDAASVSLGRKLETWSAWDQEWRQGAFQPRYMENRMRMDPAGLTGAFVNVNAEKFSMALGGLVFIPDFGAHFFVEDDRFVSKNPWFHPPATRFDLGNGRGDIHYRLEHPAVEDIVKHAGTVAKFEYRDGGYLARVSGAYKPISQFILAFPSAHQFTTNPTEDHMNIAVTPRVVYDRMVSLDNRYAWKNWTLSGSVAYSNPEDPHPPADWTVQEIRPATIFSGEVARTLGPGRDVRLGFLKVHGGDANDSGALAGPKTLFERRFQFYEAYLFGVREKFNLGWRYPIETEARVVYDRMQGGGLVAFNVGAKILKNLRAQVEADFIGLLVSNATISDGFIDEYRANDRFGLGVSYAF